VENWPKMAQKWYRNRHEAACKRRAIKKPVHPIPTILLPLQVAQRGVSSSERNTFATRRVSMRTVQVGVIGFGLGGRVFHAPVVSAIPGLQLAAIVERSGDSARAAYPNVRVVRSVEELLAIDSIELVVITTPNTTHLDLARQCLEAGRHVVVDKPFATTYTEAAEMVRIAQERGRLITVYQNRRWDGDFLTLRRLVKDGPLGRLVLLESHMERYRPALKAEAWRERPTPGSGLWFDLGPHLLDQAFVLFGPPESMTAELRTEREGAVVDDAFDVVLHYPKLRVLLRSNLLTCVPGPRFRLHGTQGSFVKYGSDPQEDALKQGANMNQPNWGQEPKENAGTLSIAEGDKITETGIPSEPGDYRRYYQNVRDAIVSGAPLDVSPEHGIAIMRALELGIESSKRGCRLPFEK
jgi:scyllo-inositol 2-dehydrogenase (NADP+)